jgi:hypothetical protein
LVSIGLVLSEEKIFEKAYDVRRRRTPSNGSSELKRDLSLKWVHNEEGKPIFKLDQLAPANGIKHNDAHDALADVRE